MGHQNTERYHLQFQFHNGTINTIIDHYYVLDLQCFNSTTVQLIHVCLFRKLVSLLFQFHNGTINTSRDWSFRATCESFNSTTVQLIPEALYNRGSRRDCFNSTTVQLIHNCISSLKIPQAFQFHNGTINTLINIFGSNIPFLVSIPQRYN